MSYINNKKSKANLLLHFEKACFYVGEFIKGNIEINTNTSAIINEIIIEISSVEEWKLKDGEKEKQDFIKKKLVTYKLNLKDLKIFKIIDDNVIIPIGISFVPFNFRFSDNNNPCFEFPKSNNRAFLRYYFSATLNSPNLNGTSSCTLCLLSRPIIDYEKKLSLSIRQNIKKWKLFEEGDTILTVSFPDNNFKYDSICKLDIEVDNINGKIPTKEYKVTFKRTINFKNKKGEIKHKDIKKIVRDRINAEVKPGHKQTFIYNLSFKEKNLQKHYNYKNQLNPYNIDIEKINFFMPTIKGQLITCEYIIKISLYFDSFVDKNHRPRIKIPIYLVHQLPIDNQLEIQEQIEFENALKMSRIEIDNKHNNIYI